MYHPDVERLFREASDRFDELRQNPVTGSRWARGIDPIGPQKRAAYRALMARERFASNNPGMPPLPLSYEEREKLKGNGGVDYIQSVYARSLEAQKYDIAAHPTFEEYARGVMASPLAPDFITQDPGLRRRFPPRALDGLGNGLYWDPPKRRRRR